MKFKLTAFNRSTGLRADSVIEANSLFEALNTLVYTAEDSAAFDSVVFEGESAMLSIKKEGE